MKDLKKQAYLKASKLGKPVEITILEGAAPEQENPKAVRIVGTISAPRRFIEKRTETFDVNKSHCLVSITEGIINLKIDEQNPFGFYDVKGKIQVGKKFLELGINTDKKYLPTELAKKLRLKRNIFKTFSDHARITSILRNIKVKVDAKIEDLDDRKGNRKVLYDQIVQSNMPETFILKLPLIEGEVEEEIEVAVVLELHQGELFCYLESVEAEDRIEELRKNLIEKEVKELEDATTVIYV